MLFSTTSFSRPASARAARAVLAAIAVIACVAYLAGGRMGIGAAQPDRASSATDDPRSQVMLSALDVPLGRPPTVSTIAARLSLAVARGRRTALRDLAAVTAAAAIAAFGASLRCAGAAIFPTALAMIGMAVGATFWSRGVSWNADALSPALALLAVSCLWRWLSTRSGVAAVSAIVLGTAAMVEDRAWLATLPGLAVFLWSRLTSPVHRRFAVAALAALAAVGATFGQGPVLLAERPSPGEFVAGMSREFTQLGAVLTVIGLSVLLRSKTTRIPAVVTAASLLTWYAATPRSQLEFVSLPLTIAAWAVIAVAFTWMLDVLSERRGLALATATTIMLLSDPALTRGRLWALGRDLPSTLAAQMAYDVPPADIPDHAAVVSESRRVDAAILLSSKQAGRHTTIVPQSPERVLAAAREGRPVFAFALGRANLERRGFVFERHWLGNAAVGALVGRLPCVDLTVDQWRDVSLLVARGSFIVHGVAPDVAPGGVVVRTTDRQPPHVTSIEPRSIPYEVVETAPDAAGIAELKQSAAPGAIDRLTTIHVAATGRRDPVIVTLDSAPFAAVAAAEGAASSLCAGVLRGLPTLGRADTASALVRMNEDTPFGPGWHPIEADPDFFRWTAATAASVRVTVGRPGPVRITVTGTPAARPAQHPAIGLTINACPLTTQAMSAGQGDYEWIAGESCWRSGVNQLWIRVTPLVSPAELFATHDTRQLGARIGAIRLARLTNQ